MQRILFQSAVAVFLFVCVTNTVYAERINGDYEMYSLLPGGIASREFNEYAIENAKKYVIDRQKKKRRREINFVTPVDFVRLNEKYISVGFEVEIVPEKKAVFALLFRVIDEESIKMHKGIYLSWVDEQDLVDYNRVKIEEICRFYREIGVADCYPGFMKTGQEKMLSKKADKSHTHSASEITSGKIAAELIDESIARDSELDEVVALKLKQSELYIETLEARIASLETHISSMKTLLAGLSRKGDTLVLSNMNLQIVNGKGHTDSSVNGKGNLIVGYNEKKGKGKNIRSGSHNIIIGKNNNYSSYGSLVSGCQNNVTGIYASVSGGKGNSADGDFSVILGGENNKARGKYSSINGGTNRTVGGVNQHFISKTDTSLFDENVKSVQ